MHIWKTSLHRLRLDWQQVFTTHLAYTVLGLVIFAPLFGLLGRLLLKLSDKPALADQDIAWFLLSPSGMVALVVMIGLPRAATIAKQIALSGTRIPAVFRLVSIILGTSFEPSKINV